MTSFHDTLTSLLQNKRAIAQQNIGVLCVTGMDAKKFLQGQITCDINKLNTNTGLYGAICSIKGRIISNFYIVQKNDDILMLMTKDLVETTLLHLKKYAVFFKAELTNTSDAFQIAAHLSSSSNSDSITVEPEKLSETLTVQHIDKITSITLSQYPIHIEWTITESSTPEVEEKHTELSALHLLDARPLISLEQSETMLPQWLNMQRTGGISFTKGCYTGQEIVARMQYKGKSKKQLALFEWNGSLDTTKDIVDEQGKTLGQVFDSSSLDKTCFAQAIINVDSTEVEHWFLDNSEIKLLPLPYLLEQTNS